MAAMETGFCASCCGALDGGAVLRGGWIFCSLECAREPGLRSILFVAFAPGAAGRPQVGIRDSLLGRDPAKNVN